MSWTGPLRSAPYRSDPSDIALGLLGRGIGMHTRGPRIVVLDRKSNLTRAYALHVLPL